MADPPARALGKGGAGEGRGITDLLVQRQGSDDLFQQDARSLLMSSGETAGWMNG